MNIFEFQARTRKIMKILELLLESHENHEKNKIRFEIHGKPLTKKKSN